MINDGLEAGGRFNFLFDFAKHGGAVGTITVGPKLIPPETVIFSGVIRVVTAVTSGGSATIAMHLSSSEDIIAATGKSSYSLDALLDVVPVGTAATSILCTAATQLSVVIAVDTLTAGKIEVSLFGFRSTTT
jgi:hypothetical protein